MPRNPWRRGAAWQDRGDSWQALESSIRLAGWTCERRVVLVRGSPARKAVAIPGGPRRGKDRQGRLPHADGESWDAQATPWSGKIAVPVISLDGDVVSRRGHAVILPQRADAEGRFDELENQWGWNGFTSRGLAPRRLMANLIALFYNRWTLYLRFYRRGAPPRGDPQPPHAHGRRRTPSTEHRATAGAR